MEHIPDTAIYLTYFILGAAFGPYIKRAAAWTWRCIEQRFNISRS